MSSLTIPGSAQMDLITIPEGEEVFFCHDVTGTRFFLVIRKQGEPLAFVEQPAPYFKTLAVNIRDLLQRMKP